LMNEKNIFHYSKASTRWTDAYAVLDNSSSSKTAS
jgi:hypothetical protein